MANDKQIKKELENLAEGGKSRFLPDEIRDPESKPPVYSLGEEFAKSRKNRGWLIYGLVGLFLAVLVGGTVALTEYIQRTHEIITVDIKDFEDINLTELLDRSRIHQEKLKTAKQELDLLREEYQRRLGMATGNAQRAKVTEMYQKRIQQKQQEVERYNRQIKEHDAKLQDVEKKAEGIVNNYQRLHKFQMDKQRDFYEARIRELILKYNPYFTSIKVHNALRGEADRELKVPELKEYQALLAREQIQSRADYQGLVKKIEHYFVLQDQMKKIPYINSVPGTINRMGFLSRTIIGSYNDIWYSMYQSMERKNAQIAHYEYALDYLLQSKHDAGYIIDPRNRNYMRVYVSRRFPVKTGDVGFVFRADDISVGKIQFFYAAYGLMAKVVSLDAGKQMEPFDKILIKVR